MSFPVKILITILIFSMSISCRKKEEVVPDVDCRISKVSMNGNLYQVFEYNDFGKIAKLIQYSITYSYWYNDKSKITDELYFEYDKNKRLTKIQSRYTPNFKVIKFHYNNDNTISFERGGYEVTSKGTIEFTEQNRIKVVRIQNSDDTDSVFEYLYFPNGNLRGVKNYTSSWNTSIEFLEYDNSINPFFSQRSEFELLNLLNDNLNFFNFVSVNNHIKTNQWYQISISHIYNKYGYPIEVNISSDRFQSPSIYNYEYENCK